MGGIDMKTEKLIKEMLEETEGDIETQKKIKEELEYLNGTAGKHISIYRYMAMRIFIKNTRKSFKNIHGAEKMLNIDVTADEIEETLIEVTTKEYMGDENE